MREEERWGGRERQGCRERGEERDGGRERDGDISRELLARDDGLRSPLFFTPFIVMRVP